MRKNLKNFILIARPDHWIKNIFILPGTVLAVILVRPPLIRILPSFFWGLVSACLISSANYVINEWADARFDKFHPTKKDRPLVNRQMNQYSVFTEFFILCICGLLIALLVSRKFFTFSLIFLFMGIIYNVRPFRTKDIPYLDVLSESFNNPIRLFLGWFIVIDSTLPPASLLMGYWMAGAFLMNVKRYAEYRYIADIEVAHLYRNSFGFYTEEKLLVSSFFYAMCSAFFIGVFLIKYRVELLLSLPVFAFLFTWYFRIGMEKDSIAQYPERLFLKRGFLAYFIFLSLLAAALMTIDIPWLKWLLNNSFVSS
jgi:4-hydroxybenzoate polyprenyltransferase